jgi:Flp pilus assembly protein TadB
MKIKKEYLFSCLMGAMEGCAVWLLFTPGYPVVALIVMVLGFLFRVKTEKSGLWTLKGN